VRSAASTSPYTVRTDDTLRLRFSATVGEEAEIEVGLASGQALVDGS
jgi:hypothetical protein